MKNLKCVFILLILSSLGSAQTKEYMQIDSLFNILYRQNQFNGAILIAEQGHTIYERGFGKANEETGEMNSISTTFDLASCSKQFTGAAIVLLKRNGKLEYSDKISTYIPELKFWDKVTIYDLLRHTSGIPDFLSDMSKGWVQNKIATNKDVVDFYASRKDTLQFIPTSAHRYSNTNYVLLATIIERVSGKTYADFLTTNIFQPLKMDHTFVYNRRQHPRKIKNHAIGYVWAKNSFKKVTSENPAYGDKGVYSMDGVVGAGKINSNVTDLIKWINALKSNAFLTQEEFKEMTEITITSSGKNVMYGFGLDLRKGENKFTYGHTGSWDGYNTFMYHNQLKDRTIIVLQNFSLGTFPFQNINQILDHTLITPEINEKKVIPEQQIMQYAGTYSAGQDSNEKHVITYKEGHLIYNTPEANWDMRFFPVSENEFKGIRQGGADATLRFVVKDSKISLEMLQGKVIIGSGVKEQ